MVEIADEPIAAFLQERVDLVSPSQSFCLVIPM